MNKTIKKIPKYRTSSEIIDDMKFAYSHLISQMRKRKKKRLIAVTITHTDSKHEKDLKHKLTNNVFNTIHKDYSNRYKNKDYINYLFVIEYPEIISKGELIPNKEKVDIHSHIVINTSISSQEIEFYFNNLIKGNIKVDDISDRTDNETYINYLIKQAKNNILTDDNYNYKINLINQN